MNWISQVMKVMLLWSSGSIVFGATVSSVSTQQVLDRLISSPYPILGMHDASGGEQENGFEVLTKQCGTRLGIWSSDFGFSTHPSESIKLRPSLLLKARKLASQGVLLTLSWHQCNPTLDEPCTFKEGVVHKPLSEDEWKELLTDDSPLNTRWKKQMDKLASYLKVLKDDGVPVLFRPYHEANIPGFWWTHTNASYSKALWRQLRGYYIKEHGLSNLIWVWSVSFHPKYWTRVAEYYPGDDVVDVIGLDIYPPTKEGMPEFEKAWTTLKSISSDKPIALSEVSRLPSPSELKKRKWAYIVPWGKNMLARDNSQAQICDIYRSEVAPSKSLNLPVEVK